MSTPGDDFGDSTGSPKEGSGRIRVSIACQHCRTRKIKCDGAMPCKKCTEANIICLPGAKRKKRAPSRKDQYIKELEKKLQDLHSLRSGSSIKDETSGRLEVDARHDSHERPVLANSALYKQGTRQLSEYQYFGASSALSSIEATAFGPSTRTITQQFGEETDLDEPDNPAFVSYYTADDDLDANRQAVQAQLPPPDVIRQYVDTYFSSFSPGCPILNENEFKASVVAFMRGKSESAPPESFIATLFMVLCFGEYISGPDDGIDNVSLVPGWRFFLSAHSGVREGLRRANIEYMQAVTLQILYLQAISKLSVAYVLLGNLIRLMQAAGMHRAQDLNTPEGVARTNLMNAVYILEKQLALGLGRPSLIQDFDCDFHTPSPPTSDSRGARYGRVALFVHMARIAGDVHRLLYTPEAARSSTQTYLQNIERCENELERWRMSYLPAFPAAGLFRREEEIPAAAFDDGFGNGISPNLITYMYLLCNVRRAVPVFHMLNDGSKIAGVDQRGVEIAISIIKIMHLDKRPIDPCIWLSIYRAFTCGTILYQSLKAKATLSNQESPIMSADDSAGYQLWALRILEEVLLHKVRGYTAAARYFAQVMRGWIQQFESVFSASRSGSIVTPVPMQQQQEYIGQQLRQTAVNIGSQHDASSAMNFVTQAAGPSVSWSGGSMQQYPQYFNPQAAPLPSPDAPAAAAFSAMYTRDLPALSLMTTINDFQGTYNWASPAQYAAHGYGPDPPSAVDEHADFSGAEMFNVGGGYGSFEIEDLMIPAWIPLQDTMPGHPQAPHGQH